MRKLVASLFVSSLWPTLPPLSPEQTVTACLQDVRSLPADRQIQARYLSLYHKDPVGWQNWQPVVSFWPNAQSREVAIAQPEWVAPGLWRVFLDNYDWKAQTWDKLLDVPEPYFNAKALLEEVKERRETRYEYKQVWNGYQYVQQKVPYKVIIRDIKEVEKTAAAPWLQAREISELITRTQTPIPVVRFDWWLFQTGNQRGRVVGYYDFLGVGNKEADFLALGAAEFNTSERLQKLHRGTVSRSAVVSAARGLKAGASLTEGVAILTEDYAKTVDDKNPLRLLEGDARPDGGEGYITLPNGLFAVWIQNADGERVDFVPDNIASDGAAPGTERIVDVGIDCFRCHKEGLRPINDWTRSTYRVPFSLEGADEDETRRLRSAYLSDLAGFVDRGNEVYAAALLRANGLTPAANAQALADAWEEYVERDRTLADTAREVGLDEKVWRDKLARAAREQRNLDPLLAALYRGLPIRVEHWEEVFPLAMRIAREGR